MGLDFSENSDITQALSKLTEPTAVPIPKLSVSNMVHSARKHIRRHRRNDQSPLSNDVLNSILLVRHSHMHTQLCSMLCCNTRQVMVLCTQEF